MIVLAAISLALAGWIYDAGRRFAGFEQSVSVQEISAMRERLALLESELDTTRKIANASESRLQIEATTQARLSAQIKALEEENTNLKADLAMFENLAGSPSGETGLAISRFQVAPVGEGGQYSYRLLLAQTGERRDREFKGMIQFVATVQRAGGTAIIQIPVGGDSAGQFQVNFRYFRRLEGGFTLDPGTRIQRIEARLTQDGAVKARQSITL